MCSSQSQRRLCKRALRFPVVALNESILHHIESMALTPESVEARHRSSRKMMPDRATSLAKEL